MNRGSKFATGAALVLVLGLVPVLNAATSTASPAGPSVTVTVPDHDDAIFSMDAAPNVQFTCDPGDSSVLKSGLDGCSASLDGGPPVPSGTPLPDGTGGAHTIVFTVTDVDSTTTSVSYTYYIDDAFPTVTLTTPPDGATYRADQVPDADYSCAGGAGSTLVDCFAVVSTGVGQQVVDLADGAPLLATVGSHTVTAEANDADARRTIVQHTYTITAAPPSVSVTTPADNASFASDAVPNLAFTCTAGTGGILKDGTDGCSASIDGGSAVASGTALAGAVGAHTVVVTVTQTDGQTASVTRHYTVVGPPTVTIASPSNGTSYPDGAVPNSSFSCTAADGATLADGLTGCSASIDGGKPVASGTALPATPGSHTVTVTASDTDGQQAVLTYHYTVRNGAPGVTITTPSDNASFPFGSVPDVGFSCTAGDGGILADGLAGCSATVDGGSPVATGAALPGAVGAHTVAVTASDTDGQTTTVTYHYTVTALAPTVTVSTPADGATYPYGSVPDLDFSCTAGAGGALKDGLAGCAASVDGADPVATGAALPGAVGPHTVAVTATDTDGQHATTTRTYSVTALPPVATLTTPTDGASYSYGSVPDAAFSCTAGSGGALAADGCTATADGNPITSGDPLPGAVGTHTVAVTALDTDGQNATASATYTVTALPPTATISTPADGASFSFGSVPDAAFSCSAGAGGTLAANGCTATADNNPLSTGDPLPGAVGMHTVAVTATDTDGQTGSASATYTVAKAATALTADAAQATLTSPLTVTATLDTNSGATMTGATIVFGAQGSTLCTATTSATGVAQCSLTGAERAAALRAGSFSADFAGNGSYLPATATAPVKLAAIHLPPQVPTGTAALHGVPAHTTPGQQIAVTATGFAPGTTVLFGIYSSPRLLGRATADMSGHASITLTIPHGMLGTHTVLAAGADQSYNPLDLSATTDISTSTTSGSGGSTGSSSSGSSGGSGGGSSSGGSGGIAITGFDALGFTGIGLLLLLVGAALLRPRRGRHSRRTRLS